MESPRVLKYNKSSKKRTNGRGEIEKGKRISGMGEENTRNK